MVDASYTNACFLWPSFLLVFLSAGVQGNSHPAGASKADGLDEGRHAVAHDSRHTGSIFRYGSCTYARILYSGLGAVAFIHYGIAATMFGCSGYNFWLNYLAPGLGAVQWPTTTLSWHMDSICTRLAP